VSIVLERELPSARRGSVMFKISITILKRNMDMFGIYTILSFKKDEEL